VGYRILDVRTGMLLAAFVLLGARGAFPQATFGTITGAITDPSGAAVRGASVTVTNQGTGVAKTALSDDRGNYEVTHLNPGTYTVAAEASGFRKFEHRELVLGALQTARVDMQLQIASTGSEVTVTAGTPVVETDTATISEVKSAKELRDLPLNTLNGVILNAFLFSTPTGYQTAGSKFAMGGARGTQLYYNIDGISANSPAFGVQNSPAEPSVESMAELKFNLVENKAEFGEVTNVTAITKSGQNELHGRLFEQNTTSVLNARPTFAATKGQNIINDFGASVGGPIRRNKTFFFGTYEGFRQRVPAILSPSVPTLKMRAGDFSELLPATVIMNPFTGQPFPGNVIPTAMLDQAALKWQQQFFPEPNFGAPNLTVANYRNTFPQETRQDQFDVRVDHYFTPRHTVYARFSYKRLRPHALDSGVPPQYAGYRVNVRNGRLAAVSDTWTITPHLINEFKLGFARGYNPREGELSGQAIIDAMGIQGLPRQADDVHNIPSVSISNFVNIFQVAKEQPAENTFQGIDQVTFIRGAHTFKAGAEYRPQQSNNYVYPSFGSYSFTNLFSRYSYADFMLGLPQSTSRVYPRPSNASRFWFLSGFFQDDWKVSSRLTLSLGLRYEYDSPPVDKFDTISNFDPKTGSIVVPNETVRKNNVNPLFPASIPIITAAQAGFPERSLREGDRNNFQPRFGFAYRPFGGNSTVVRGGYGIFNDDLTADLFGQFYGGPFRVTESFTNSFTAGVPLLTFRRPFLGVGSTGAVTMTGIVPDLHNPFIEQWNLTVERELTGDTGVRISYIGTRATSLIYGRNINQPRASSTPFNQNRRPYPLFQNITIRENGGTQIYHALSVQVDRRFSRGLSFNAAWTWAKTLTDADEVGITEGGPTLEDAYNRRRERADAQYSPRHRLVTSLIWELPLGTGRRWMNHGGPADWVFGGWQTSAVFNSQTGEFMTPTFSGSDPSNTNTIGGIPDRIANGNLPDSQRTADRWFDASAFVAPAAGRFGNSARNILLSPGRYALNLGVFKTFHPTEKTALRVQATFTNATNHPNYGYPNLGISAPASVGIIRSNQARDSGGARSGLLAVFFSF
jgi:hypothetical protein